jgi:periplasmic protein TonB
MEFNLGGTDSQSNAIASGADIVPASIDKKVRNKPPLYPDEAVRLGQQGAVIVLIHVTPNGVAGGADILQSSGSALLDQSALDAVMTWRFLPAVKDGAPMPFDLPMRFVFEFK